MSLRARRTFRFHFSIAVCALASALLLGACGGGSSDDGADGAKPAGGDGDAAEVDLDRAGELVDGAVADTSAEAMATVVMGGTTYEFKAMTDPAGERTTYCTAIAGSVQGDLLLVDESGAVVEDGAVSFTLFEPDAEFADGEILQDLTVDLPSGPDIVGPYSYMADGETIESEVSDRSASATFTGRHHTGDLQGTIDVAC